MFCFYKYNLLFLQNTSLLHLFTIRLIRQKIVLIRIYNNLLLQFFIRCHFCRTHYLHLFSSTFTVIYSLSYKKAKSGNGDNTYHKQRFWMTQSANKYSDQYPLLIWSLLLIFELI
jgi:hypothetical protein